MHHYIRQPIQQLHCLSSQQQQQQQQQNTRHTSNVHGIFDCHSEVKVEFRWMHRMLSNVTECWWCIIVPNWVEVSWSCERLMTSNDSLDICTVFLHHSCFAELSCRVMRVQHFTKLIVVIWTDVWIVSGLCGSASLIISQWTSSQTRRDLGSICRSEIPSVLFLNYASALWQIWWMLVCYVHHNGWKCSILKVKPYQLFHMLIAVCCHSCCGSFASHKMTKYNAKISKDDSVSISLWLQQVLNKLNEFIKCQKSRIESEAKPETPVIVAIFVAREV